MGGVYGNKWSPDSMMWLTLASVFALWAFTVSSANLVSEREFGNYKHGRRKPDDTGGKSLLPLIEVARYLILRHGVCLF